MTTTLLDGALRSSGAILVFGGNPPTTTIVESARAAWTASRLLDLRDAAAVPKNGSLRRRVAEELAAEPALIVLVGAEVPDSVREVLAEIVEGQLNLPGEVRRLDERTRLLVVSPVDHPDVALSGLFATRLPVARALGAAPKG